MTGIDVTDAEVLKRQPATVVLLALQVAAVGVEVGWSSLRRYVEAHRDALLMLVPHARGQGDRQTIRRGIALDRVVLEVVEGVAADGDAAGWTERLQARIVRPCAAEGV